MVTGGFDNEGRPTILAEVGSRDATNCIPIRFLIDTGGINTIIMPGDSNRFHVDFGRLHPAHPINIAGSSIPCYMIDITLDLINRGTVYTYIVKDARIVDPTQSGAEYPSILGPKVWSRWGLMIIPGKVEITPLNPDQQVP